MVAITQVKCQTNLWAMVCDSVLLHYDTECLLPLLLTNDFEGQVNISRNRTCSMKLGFASYIHS